jgi:hypothetical protein
MVWFLTKQSLCVHDIQTTLLDFTLFLNLMNFFIIVIMSEEIIQQDGVNTCFEVMSSFFFFFVCMSALNS